MTTTTPTPVSHPLTRDDRRGLFGRTMGLVALTATAFATGGYLGADASSCTMRSSLQTKVAPVSVCSPGPT